ncbi:MAG: hypothetical protein ABI969_09260 [bacterium]
MKVATSALIALAVAAPAVARAQAPDLRVAPELRVDAIVSEHRTAVQAGGGVQIPAGYYARIGITGAAGADFLRGETDASARVDVIGRFLFDPFRQNRWGLSAGAGVSLRAHTHDWGRPFLVAVVDLEGPRGSSGVAPTIQVGLGGGVRLGLGMRWGTPGAR